MKKLVFAAALLLLAGNSCFAQNATIAGGSSTPSGAAGGTLGGTYPNPTIAATITPATAIGIVNASPKTLLDANANAASSPALVVSTSLARLQAADASIGGMEFASYGANPGNILSGIIAGGVSGTPTFTPTAKNMFNLRGYGYNGASFQLGGLISITSVNQWSNTDQSSQINFFTTPTGSTTIAAAMQVNPSGGVSIGTATDPGLGGLRAAGATIQFTALASDVATTDNTVCINSSGTLLKGSGALGICLGTSGRQFKTAFAPMAAGLDEITKLPLLNYRYLKGFGDSGERMQYGLTAQDVEAVLPDLVRHNASGEAINYDAGALLPISLRAIQQLNARIDELELKLAAGTKKENR